MQQIAPAAYLASWAHTFTALPDRFPSLWDSTTALLSNLHGLQFDVEDAIAKYNAHLGSDGDSNALVSLSDSLMMLSNYNTN